jgi:glycosyltransferase involved in cell wall biosynthesis
MARQSRAPDQLIIVDQDPLAETRDIVAQSDLKITYVEQARRGVSASRNLALSKATGAVLATIDDDCFPDPRWLEALIDGFNSPATPDAVTGPILPPPGDTPAGMCALSLRPSRETRLFSGRVAPWLVGSGGNFAARTETLRAIHGWDQRLGPGSAGKAGEDIEMIDRLLAAGRTILYQGDAVVHHAWQTAQRRRATRWSYGYGMGALCGVRLRQWDGHGFLLLASYTRTRVRELLREARRGRWSGVREHITSISALAPSLFYGLRTTE